VEAERVHGTYWVPIGLCSAVAVISSMDWYKAPSHYHWPTDRPENLPTESIAGAARLADALVRRLDRDPSAA
jgi:hypothetical protein